MLLHELVATRATLLVVLLPFLVVLKRLVVEHAQILVRGRQLLHRGAALGAGSLEALDGDVLVGVQVLDAGQLGLDLLDVRVERTDGGGVLSGVMLGDALLQLRLLHAEVVVRKVELRDDVVLLRGVELELFDLEAQCLDVTGVRGVVLVVGALEIADQLVVVILGVRRDVVLGSRVSEFDANPVACLDVLMREAIGIAQLLVRLVLLGHDRVEIFPQEAIGLLSDVEAGRDVVDRALGLVLEVGEQLLLLGADAVDLLRLRVLDVRGTRLLIGDGGLRGGRDDRDLLRGGGLDHVDVVREVALGGMEFCAENDLRCFEGRGGLLVGDAPLLELLGRDAAVALQQLVSRVAGFGDLVELVEKSVALVDHAGDLAAGGGQVAGDLVQGVGDVDREGAMNLLCDPHSIAILADLAVGPARLATLDAHAALGGTLRQEVQVVFRPGRTRVHCLLRHAEQAALTLGRCEVMYARHACGDRDVILDGQHRRRVLDRRDGLAVRRVGGKLRDLVEGDGAPEGLVETGGAGRGDGADHGEAGGDHGRVGLHLRGGRNGLADHGRVDDDDLGLSVVQEVDGLRLHGVLVNHDGVVHAAGRCKWKQKS